MRNYIQENYVSLSFQPFNSSTASVRNGFNRNLKRGLFQRGTSSHDVQNEEIPVTKNHLECYSANELVIIMNPIQVWFDTYKAAKKSTSLFFADPSSKTSSRMSFLENVYHRREQQCSPFCPLHLIKLTPTITNKIILALRELQSELHIQVPVLWHQE